MSAVKSKLLKRNKCASCSNKNLPGASRCRSCQDKVNKRQRELRAKNKAKGLCKCGRQPPRAGKADCSLCYREMAKVKNVTYRKRRRAGLCVCGEPPTKGYKTCETCRDNSKRKHESLRKAALAHYGLKCACCGEDTYEFLEIDHIDGDGRGNDHRRQMSSGTYQWLKSQGYPEGFQTLCSNCNRAKFRYGSCPHQRENNP